MRALSRTRWAHGILILLLLGCSGSSSLVLQGIGWATMLGGYLASVPLAEAVSRTFDGRHPCDLCEAVRKERSDESQKQATPDSRTEILFPMPNRGLSIYPPRPVQVFPSIEEEASRIPHVPEILPPRSGSSPS